MDSSEGLKISGKAEDDLTNLPKKNVLHFSDGTLDLDELDVSPVETENTVDPQKLTWAPWMLYYTMFAGSKALEVCDYLGEFFATFFGITTPKYQYEINEYHRMQKEELKQMKEIDLERNNSLTNTVERDTMDPSKKVEDNIEVNCTDTIHFERC